jgi:hypothetical protein
LPFRNHSRDSRQVIAKSPKRATRARISSEPNGHMMRIPMRESLMTDRQEPRNEGGQLADEHTIQDAAPGMSAKATPHADRRDGRRRSIGYGWSAAGTTLVI